MTKDNVDRARKALHRVLSEVGWADDADDHGTCYIVDLGMPHVPVAEVVLSIDFDTESLMFLASFAPNAPPECRDEMMRYITRANWDLDSGNLELDIDEGATRYRMTVDFIGGELTEKTIRHAILTSMTIVEEHAEAMMAIATGGDETS